MAALNWRQEPEDSAARRMVYLVTFSALLNQGASPELRDPTSLSREEVKTAVLDAVANLVQVENNSRGGRPRTRALTAQKLVVVQEEHEDREACHYHVALKLSAETRFLPLKEALRQRSKLASHWSTSHTQMWSAVRYCVVPTDHKPQVDQTPLVWTSDGKELNLFEEAQEPFNAKALKKRREMLSLAPAPEGKQPKVARFNKMDLTSLILAEGLRSPAEVMAHVQEKGSLEMQAFVNKVQRRLPEYLEDAKAWSTAQASAAAAKETDWQLLVRTAGQQCSCTGGGCEWWDAAITFFERNLQIDREHLASALCKVIAEGPSKTARVPLITGPRNAGKSTVLEPLVELFGHDAIVNKPKLGASCPLRKLVKDGARFIFFDDFRPVDYASLPRDNPTVAVTTFLAMFCGQPFDVQVSQSFHDGHPQVTWKRGAAITAKAEGLWQPTPAVPAEEIRHMQARVYEFKAEAVIAEHSFRTLPKCAASFAKWLLHDSRAFSLRMPRQVAVGQRVPLPIVAEDGAEHVRPN